MRAIVHAAGVNAVYLADHESVETRFRKLPRQQRLANIPPPIFKSVRVRAQGRLQHAHAEMPAVCKRVDRFRSFECHPAFIPSCPFEGHQSKYIIDNKSMPFYDDKTSDVV